MSFGADLFNTSPVEALMPSLLRQTTLAFTLALSIGLPAPADGGASRAALPQSSEQVAEVLDRFAKAEGGEQARLALDIFFNNPEAKLALKLDPKLASVSRRFSEVMSGRDGTAGLAAEALGEFRKRMTDAGYADALVAKFERIRNQASAGTISMDDDVGLKADTPGEQAELRKLIGSPSDVETFHRKSQQLLEDAWSTVARQHGLEPPNREVLERWLAATTPWHPEAYLASEVLKAGGIPGKSLLQQTADVTLYKVSKWAAVAEAGEGWAAKEMARAVLKDLDKVDRVFREVERLTGTRPAFSPASQALIAELTTMVAADTETAARLFKGKGGWVTRCDGLVRQMESAVVFAPTAQILKARFYATRLPADVLREALNAIIDEDPARLPVVAKALDRELSKVAGLYLVALDPVSPQTFVRRLMSRWEHGAAALQLGAGDDVIAEFLGRQLETLPDAGLKVWFDPKSVERLTDLRVRLSPDIKKGIAAKLATRLPASEIDSRITTTLLAGDAQAAGGGANAARGLAFFDGAIGAATALIETSAIMDEGLPPEVERRRIGEAWTRAIPVIGDVYAASGALGTGGWGYLEGALHVAIAVSYVVPQVQVPAIIGTLAMATYSVGSSIYEVDVLRRLIGTWVASGAFEPTSGRMIGLYDADHRPRQTPRRSADPREQATQGRRALEVFYTNGGQPYCCQPPLPASLGVPGDKPLPTMLSIRASLLDYVERAYRLSRDPNVEATRTAIGAAYPTFDIDAALAQPGDLGRQALEMLIREGNDTPTRTPTWALYRQLERIYEEAALAGIWWLTSQAEREYQATHMVGEAAEVYRRLNELGTTLRLPLAKHVDQIHNSAFELVRGVWDEHSRAVQRLDLAKTFVDGYSGIGANIAHVGELCRRHGVNPPTKYWLSGFLRIDRPRVDELERAYSLALSEADADLRRVATALKLPYDRSQACQATIYRELAQLRVNIVYARDYELLLAEWSGRLAAAERSRDETLARIQDRLSRNEPVVSTLTALLYQAQEVVLGWHRENWADQGVFAEGAAAFESARSAADSTRLRLEGDYAKAYAAAGVRLAQCTATPTSALEDAVKAALRTLGYDWRPFETQGRDIVPAKDKGGHLLCRTHEESTLVSSACQFEYLFAASEKPTTGTDKQLTGKETRDGWGFEVSVSPLLAEETELGAILKMYQRLPTDKEAQTQYASDAAGAWERAYRSTHPDANLTKEEAVALFTGPAGPLRKHRGVLGYVTSTEEDTPWHWKTSQALTFKALDAQANAVAEDQSAIRKFFELIARLGNDVPAIRKAWPSWPPFGTVTTLRIWRGASCWDARFSQWAGQFPVGVPDTPEIRSKIICAPYTAVAEPMREASALLDELLKAGLIVANGPAEPKSSNRRK